MVNAKYSLNTTVLIGSGLLAHGQRTRVYILNFKWLINSNHRNLIQALLGLLVTCFSCKLESALVVIGMVLSVLSQQLLSLAVADWARVERFKGEKMLLPYKLDNHFKIIWVSMTSESVSWSKEAKIGDDQFSWLLFRFCVFFGNSSSSSSPSSSSSRPVGSALLGVWRHLHKLFLLFLSIAAWLSSWSDACPIRWYRPAIPYEVFPSFPPARAHHSLEHQLHDPFAVVHSALCVRTVPVYCLSVCVWYSLSVLFDCIA